MCETLAKIVCRTSRLKCDDIRYRSATHSQRVCERCDLSVVETIGHLIMQCPSASVLRDAMVNEIKQIDPYFDDRCMQSPDEATFWLLGKHIEGVEHDLMGDIWKIAGVYVQRMYLEAMANRESDWEKRVT